ncbi:MAG: cyanophycin synthetase [Bacteroidota bacterium]|nr:cyanophycin synthetase [Bacteroidota bacterium]
MNKELEKLNINIHYSDDINLIPKKFKNNKNTVIVYTPAIPKNHKEYNFFKAKNFTLKKRAEILGDLSKNKKTVAIAGTHGKTTITSITSHVFNIGGKLNAAFIGGILKNYKSNFIIDDNNLFGWLIAEADEFDRSFLQFKPYLSIISSIDADHLDIYGTKKHIISAFEQFVEQTENIIILNDNVKLNTKDKKYVFNYGLKENSCFRALNIRTENDKQLFDIIYPDGMCKDFSIAMPGRVNIENSLATFAAAFFLGIDVPIIKIGLSTFKGIERRFDLILKNEKNIFINDYAHHPHEINRLVEAINNFYPNKKVTAVFQPHLFSRTRDFAKEFAKSLSKFDDIIITDIYPARETPIEGVTSKIIFDKIENENKTYCAYDKIIETIENKKPELLLTIGAGDIDNLVESIKKTLLN